MSSYPNKGIWKQLYHRLRVLGPDTFVEWGTYEGMTDRSRFASRAALVRARQELECQDGLTLTGQCAEGFWIKRQEDA